MHNTARMTNHVPRATTFASLPRRVLLPRLSPIPLQLTYTNQLLRPTNNTTSCSLLKLPPEILIQIFTQSPPVEAILLALTCRPLLSIAHLCNLQVPCPRSHRQPWALALTPLASSNLGSVSTKICRCRQLGSILPRVRVGLIQSRRSRAWGLCVDCASYRPTRKSYWSRRLDRLNTQDWGKDRGDVWQSAVRWFAAGVKVQCPTCQIAEHDLDRAAEEMGDIRTIS